MKMYELLIFVSLALLTLRYYTSDEKNFIKWLFERGFIKFMLKSFILLIPLIYILYKLLSFIKTGKIIEFLNITIL